MEAGEIWEISALSLCYSETKSVPIKLSVLSKAKTKPTTTVTATNPGVFAHPEHSVNL